MNPEDAHNNAQQDQGDKAPKYPSPRLMTAAVDGRFFGFLIHEATANPIFAISVELLSSARELFTRFDVCHFCIKSLDASFGILVPASAHNQALWTAVSPSSLRAVV
jgi:hypothetical protein